MLVVSSREVTYVAPTQLTAREIEIRDLAAGGKTNEQIAGQLGLSRRTVEAHLRMVYRKTGHSRRGDLNTRSEDGESSRIHELEERLALRERQLQSYEAAMKRIIDRQFPLYDEKVEITIKIGSNSLEDIVTEKHWTDPNPYLVYRVIRPITPFGPASDDIVESLAITCEIDRADVGIAVQAIADRGNRPYALVLFQPGLEGPAEWTLRYRTPGLWDPLRRDGIDHLCWTAGTIDKRHHAPPRELRLHFEFPPGAEEIAVSDRQGAGQTERLSPTDVRYIDHSRTGGLHEWQLRMARKV